MSNPSVVAILPAAGSSSRMKLADSTATSKIFLELAERSVIERSLDTIIASSYIQAVVVLVRQADRQQVLEISKNYDKPIYVELGGETRQESVASGLEFIRSNPELAKVEYIAIHDTARCLLSRDLLDRSIELAFEWQAVTTALAVVDSVLELREDHSIENYVDRDALRLVQTPQVFRSDLLTAAHQQVNQTATDDASLVAKIHAVKVIEGEKSNIKITTQEDLWLGEFLLGRVGARK